MLLRFVKHPFLPVALLSAALFLPICNLLHRCGCAAPWSGAETHCNVHLPQGPHCPWCEHPWLGAGAGGLVLAGQVVVFRAARRRWGAARAVVAATLALLPTSIVVGAVAWLPTDYPHFLVHGARSRLGVPRGPIPCVAPRGPAQASSCCGPRS